MALLALHPGFYLLGTTVWDKLKPEQPPAPKSGDEVKISLRVSL